MTMRRSISAFFSQSIMRRGRAAPLRATMALLLGFTASACTPDPTESECVAGQAGCGCVKGTCATGLTCDESDTCVFATSASGSGGGSPAGDLPCSGCAGAICVDNSDCVDGFICGRLNSDIAWCTNCNALGSCNSFCTADVNCGAIGVCHVGYCWHGCATDADCPSGHGCVTTDNKSFCAPIALPKLDDDCIEPAAGWCQSFVEGTGACVFTGTDPQTDPGENWCSKKCLTNTDCTDVWPLGCCSADGVFQNDHYCLRPAYAGLCM